MTLWNASWIAETGKGTQYRCLRPPLHRKMPQGNVRGLISGNCGIHAEVGPRRAPRTTRVVGLSCMTDPSREDHIIPPQFRLGEPRRGTGSAHNRIGAPVSPGATEGVGNPIVSA